MIWYDMSICIILRNQSAVCCLFPPTQYKCNSVNASISIASFIHCCNTHIHTHTHTECFVHLHTDTNWLAHAIGVYVWVSLCLAAAVVFVMMYSFTLVNLLATLSLSLSLCVLFICTNTDQQPKFIGRSNLYRQLCVCACLYARCVNVFRKQNNREWFEHTARNEYNTQQRRLARQSNERTNEWTETNLMDWCSVHDSLSAVSVIHSQE